MILDKKIFPEKKIKEIDDKVFNIIKNAAEFAENSPVPNIEDLYKDVYA